MMRKEKQTAKRHFPTQSAVEQLVTTVQQENVQNQLNRFNIRVEWLGRATVEN
jgi:hypothetical protein